MGDERGSRVADRLGRHWHHAALLVWLGLCVAVYGRHGGQSWHFLDTGARSLFCLPPLDRGPCGLHVYAQHPDLQIGPLSLAVAVLPVLASRLDGFDLARTAMALAGPLVIALLEPPTPDDAAARRRTQGRVLLAGLAFLTSWADLAVGFGHLDDVLALVFTAAAVRDLNRSAPGRHVGRWLALAVLSKPWAVAFLPLALAAPPGRRRRALALAVLVPAATAAVFVLADPNTLRAAAFRIPNAAASCLRLFGVADATPPWDRPAQFTLGIALSAWAVRVGRWRATVMIAAAVRVMLDPQVYSYYTAGVLLGTLCWDLQVRRGRLVPLWTWAVFAALFACRYLPLEPTVLACLRLAISLTLIGFALLAPGALARWWPRSHRVVTENAAAASDPFDAGREVVSTNEGRMPGFTRRPGELDGIVRPEWRRPPRPDRRR